MKKALTIVAAAAAAMLAQGAFAQASAPTRAEVKSDAKAARTPAGEGPGAMSGAPDTKSSTTRSERKARTRAAVKSGETVPAGEGPDAGASGAGKSTSTTSRAERRAKTRAAVKEGSTIPAGEGPQAPKK